MVVSADPNDVLVVFGLGSCVVVCLYDPVVRVGSMLHALLPNRPDSNNVNGRPTKYVDEGVPLLIDSLVALGAKPARLRAYLCGGAQMIIKPGYNDSRVIHDNHIPFGTSDKSNARRLRSIKRQITSKKPILHR